MPRYLVTLRETTDRKQREAVARDDDGMIACAVLRGTSTRDLIDVRTTSLDTPTPYLACTEVLDATS